MSVILPHTTADARLKRYLFRLARENDSRIRYEFTLRHASSATSSSSRQNSQQSSASSSSSEESTDHVEEKYDDAILFRPVGVEKLDVSVDQPLLEGEQISADDILFVLRCHGSQTTREIARTFRLLGFVQCTKTSLNRIIFKMRDSQQVLEKPTEWKAPLWVAASSERTSFDELWDLAQESNAAIGVSFFFRTHEVDGDRVECSLVWKVRDRADAVVAATAVRLLEPDAKIYAAHALLRELRQYYTKENDASMCEKLRRLYSLALQRGLSYARGRPYPFGESTFLEFKGSEDEQTAWTRKLYSDKLSEQAVLNAAAMWNSFLLNQSDDVGRIYFGIHDNRTMNGIKIPCLPGDDVAKSLDALQQDLIARFTTQLQSSKVVFYPSTASVSDLTKSFSCEIIRLRDESLDALYFLALITVKRPETQLLLEYDKVLRKRTGENCKPEVIPMTPTEIRMLLNKIDPVPV